MPDPVSPVSHVSSGYGLVGLKGALNGHLVTNVTEQNRMLLFITKPILNLGIQIPILRILTSKYIFVRALILIKENWQARYILVQWYFLATCYNARYE